MCLFLLFAKLNDFIMKKLSELFYECAYVGNYKQAGNFVTYKFVEEGSTLYIYFEGSNEMLDWVRNFLFKKVPYKDIDVKFRVHQGFLQAWKEVEDIIVAKVTERATKESLNRKTKKLVTKEYYLWKKIIVVGYSHGGALSGLAHEAIWYHRPDLRENGLYGYGFESPRFYAGLRVKKELKERWSNYTVIRTNNDLVTHCPPALFNYCHVGKMLKIKGDSSLVKNKLPKCIKSHFPNVVLDALKKHDKQ